MKELDLVSSCMVGHSAVLIELSSQGLVISVIAMTHYMTTKFHFCDTSKVTISDRKFCINSSMAGIFVRTQELQYM